jgi:hypothetical protein
MLLDYSTIYARENGTVPSEIQTIFRKNVRLGIRMSLSNGRCIVYSEAEEFEVNLDEKTCSCGAFCDLGYQCEHTFCVIASRMLNFLDFVD